MNQPEGFFDHYAEVYAQASYATFAADIADTLPALWSAHGLDRLPRVLDLACGTGLMLDRLHGSISEGVGIDQSERMIALASRTTATNLHFRVGDIREVQDEASNDLVTIIYNTLNYFLDEDDLSRVISAAARALRPGGLLLFDVHDPDYIRANWSNRSFIVQSNDDVFEATHNAYVGDSEVLRTDIVWFQRRGDVWLKGQESHLAIGWSNSTIKRVLERHHLELVGTFGDIPGQATTGDDERTFFLARR